MHDAIIVFNKFKIISIKFTIIIQIKMSIKFKIVKNSLLRKNIRISEIGISTTALTTAWMTLKPWILPVFGMMKNILILNFRIPLKTWVHIHTEHCTWIPKIKRVLWIISFKFYCSFQTGGRTNSRRRRRKEASRPWRNGSWRIKIYSRHHRVHGRCSSTGRDRHEETGMKESGFFFKRSVVRRGIEKWSRV